ncbi:wax ester/triacylglycerol synthase domain-containing protein [Propionicimonas sp.]|uniref:wax ester/triacylglycerol synthase domain-containing protein n=1 Tax=Propionicimonas sp. TaxID=1955623 RepID=UPI0039E34167
MSEPVTVTEAALLARDQQSQPWQQAVVAMLSGPLTRAELIDRMADRIEYAPRFRRLVGGWPMPAWVDDTTFSVAGHVRTDSLAAGQRMEDWLAARLTEPLDRTHPLWQATLVGGIAPGTQALVMRVHPALVDGYDNVHLLQELFDTEPAPVSAPATGWVPEDARPPGLADIVTGLADPLGMVTGAATGLLGMVENAVRTLAASPRPQYVAGVEVDLDVLADLRGRHGCTTHDLLLALASAGVRGWLEDNRRQLADPVALVPLAVQEPAVLESAIGCRIAPSWLGLPVGASPAGASSAGERLRTLATLTRARIDTGVSVPARDLIELAGFAPPTLHAVAAGTVAAGRPHTITISNVPGPTGNRYLGRARLRQVYALTATTDDEQVNVSITSYRGRVTLGATAVAPLPHWARDVGAELAALREEL